MDPSAEPARAPHVLPGLSAPSRSPESYASYAQSDRYYTTASPSHRPSVPASQSDSVQLPSLRTLIHPTILNPVAPSASPAPVTRLPSLSGFDQGLPTDRSVNGHAYAPREENYVPASASSQSRLDLRRTQRTPLPRALQVATFMHPQVSPPTSPSDMNPSPRAQARSIRHHAKRVRSRQH